MMRLSYLKTHWTPEEAHTILTYLDDLRDALWETYGNEIIEYCHQQNRQESDSLIDFEDEKIPF